MSASYRDTRPAQQQAGSAYPSIPTDNTQTPFVDWQRQQTGVLTLVGCIATWFCHGPKTSASVAGGYT